MAPHPDDEAIGAPCTLLQLVDAGSRVVVVACGLGRAADHPRRSGELRAATATAGFELVVRDPPVALGSTDDLDATQDVLGQWLTGLIDSYGADLVVSPHLHDAHPAHEAVARAVRDAIMAARRPPVWWAWGIWADVRTPTLLVPAPEEVVNRALAVLACYAGEVTRNDYPVMLRALGRLGAVRGVERVLGFGSAALPGVRHAELLVEVGLTGGRWRFGAPRVAHRPGLPVEWGRDAVDYAMPCGTGQGCTGGGRSGESTRPCRRTT